MFVPLPVLERIKALVRLFRGRFNSGQARNDFNVRLALFLLLRLDFVRVGLDVANFGKNGRVALCFVGNVLFPIPGKSNVSWVTASAAPAAFCALSAAAFLMFSLIVNSSDLEIHIFRYRKGHNKTQREAPPGFTCQVPFARLRGNQRR